MSKAREGFLRVILTMVVALAIGALLIIGIGENPISAYGALLQGAFDGKFRLGTTLAGFTPLLLTSTAFAIAAKAGAFTSALKARCSWEASWRLTSELTGRFFRNRCL